MAEPTETASMDRGSAAHDGRFGERFDAEVSVSGIVWTTVGLAAACALGMWITWVMKGYYADRAAAAVPTPVVGAAEQRLPEGPLLQRDPEGELQALRREMSERLSSYGWVDEGAGIVHIPIDEAMDLLVERGSVAASGAAAGTPETAAESSETAAEEPAE